MLEQDRHHRKSEVAVARACQRHASGVATAASLRRHTMLIDINPVAPLRYVRNDAGFVEIGAMTR
jgi:hypothetical protein